jgi:benzoyl-CoA-dihydrodiol lyase
MPGVGDAVGASADAATDDGIAGEVAVRFDTCPAAYRHWRIEIEPPVATLTLAVDPAGGLRPDVELKSNSYDLTVDVELADAVERLRFEHPEVHAVIVTSALDKVFCAGANIQMLATATHHHKVNFCKFTNETRNGMEDASRHSGQAYLAALNGTAAGGGYELALACDEIVLVDDRSSTVSLPEVALLGVLPGTGGLTRVTDKRLVRRDLADVFATRAEGIGGAQAVAWRLVDQVAPPSTFAATVRERALALAARSDRPTAGPGVPLGPVDERWVQLTVDRRRRTAEVVVRTPPVDELPGDAAGALAQGDAWWPLALARELDRALLRIRFDEPEVATIVIRSEGDEATVLATDDLLLAASSDWFVREVRLLLARVLRRLDLTSRTIVTLLEPGSCFSGTLAELVLAADRSYHLDGTIDGDDRPAPTLRLGQASDGWYPMANGITRLATRCWGRPDDEDAVRARLGTALPAAEAAGLGLVTFTPDDLDWDDEVRLALEERASFSPDALTGLEANCRFAGPETMETKIFARLSAWQNWIFQRPNASGPDGALRRYGTGTRPTYDPRRV